MGWGTGAGSGPRALIIGGGIGGLAAAIALRRLGIEAVVYERAPELGEVGAGLSLWANAMQALHQLGLAEAVAAAGAPVAHSQLRTWDGRVLSEFTLGGPAAAPGTTSVCIHRAHLQEVLLRALDPSVVRLGFHCLGFQQDTAGVVARFANGEEARADFLVGADGIHSMVRAQLHPDQKLRYAGYLAWRGIAPLEHPSLAEGRTFVNWGRGRTFGALAIGPGRVYWFGTSNSAAGSPEPPVARQQEVLACFSGWQEPVAALVQATPGAEILRNDVYDLKPLNHWGEGRVTLLGDAAHAATPNLGQGACQSLEDAVALAQAFKANNEVAAALRKYEAFRRGRTAFIIRLSRWQGTLEQWENPLACRLRNAAVKLVPTGIKRRGFQRLTGFEG